MPITTTTKRNATSGVLTNQTATQGGEGFNIADFRAFRDPAGILRQHDYLVKIPLPDGLKRTAENTALARVLELTCDSINFPATGHVNYQVQRYSYGALERKPTGPRFADLACTFVTDQYSDLWRLFTDWIRVAVNFEFDANPSTNYAMDVYEISYKPEYAVDMELHIFNPQGDLVRQVGFRQAYPTMVEDVPLNWAIRDQLIRVPVIFSFFDWHEYSLTAARSTFGTPAAQGFAIK